MPLTLRYIARSDTGLVREGNEDAGYAGPYLLAVADGMGGHAAGEVASQAAIDELIHAENPPTATTTTPDDPLAALTDAIRAANSRIRQLIADDTTREGMGTTITAMLWTGAAIALGHIGDSRAYLLRDGELRQLTHDHTFVQSLVDEGRITAEEAGIHPARSLILKALQGQAEVEPDLELLDAKAGDRVLVCSDGLTGVVSDATLKETLESFPQLHEAADELIRLALAGGAPDNVTLALGDIVETETPREPDDTAEAYLVGAAAAHRELSPERSRRGPGAVMRGLLGYDEKPADPDELEALRYAPRPPRGFRWIRALIAVAAVVLIGWAGLNLANNWIREQYYIGQSSGEVAIYQGVSQEVGPVRLSELHEIPGGLPVEALPSLYREQVEETITADSLADAEDVVATLRRRACSAQGMLDSEGTPPTTASPTPTPTAAPSRPAQNAATGRPSPSPTRRPRPRRRGRRTRAARPTTDRWTTRQPSPAWTARVCHEPGPSAGSLQGRAAPRGTRGPQEGSRH